MSIISHIIQTEHFEVDQYVRVQLTNGRSEIGVVVHIDEPNGVAVVETRHGYEITVRLSSVRRAFLLVLDLNGVLVARGRGSFVNRPGVDDFVSFVMNNFVVAVWTSGLERTSNPIIDKVFDGYQDRLLFKLYRDSCTVLPTPEKPYRTIKNLQRIFDEYPKSFHAVNTIIVDDSPDKCSHPDIALCPVPFNDPEKQINDNGLAMAMEVLKEILRTESSASLIRASEERLLALAAQEQDKKNCEQGILAEQNAKSQKEFQDTSRCAELASFSETHLWATRLCCEHISGRCVRDECRFSHDADDGKRPCSRKDLCRRGHAHRWIEGSGGAGEATSNGQAKTIAEVRTSANAPKVVSSFFTCAERQTQHQRSEESYLNGVVRKSREWERIKQQLRQQEEMLKQTQEKQKRQQQQQQHGLQNKGQRGERKGRQDSDGQKNKSVSLGGKSDATQKRHLSVTNFPLTSSNGNHHCDDPLLKSTASRGVSVHISADSQDGFALLRQLQATLSSSTGGVGK